jgi:hypothetical protein
MMAAHRSIVLALALLVLAPSLGAADPIRIVDGSLTADNQLIAQLVMTGDSRGFTWQSDLSIFFAAFEPAGPLLPGDSVGLGAGWVGLNILGSSVTVDGFTHTRVGGLGVDDPQARLGFFGTAGVLPDEGTEITFIAPFSFEGSFGHYVDPSIPLPGTFVWEELVGGGIATVTYGRGTASTSDPTAWNFRSATYQFDVPAAVPEPSTLLLIASGLMATRFRRRR